MKRVCNFLKTVVTKNFFSFKTKTSFDLKILFSGGMEAKKREAMRNGTSIVDYIENKICAKT